MRTPALFEIGDKWNVLVACLFVFVYRSVDLPWAGDVHAIDVILRAKHATLIILILYLEQEESCCFFLSQRD